MPPFVLMGSACGQSTQHTIPWNSIFASVMACKFIKACQSGYCKTQIFFTHGWLKADELLPAVFCISPVTSELFSLPWSLWLEFSRSAFRKERVNQGLIRYPIFFWQFFEIVNSWIVNPNGNNRFFGSCVRIFYRFWKIVFFRHMPPLFSYIYCTYFNTKEAGVTTSGRKRIQPIR